MVDEHDEEIRAFPLHRDQEKQRNHPERDLRQINLLRHFPHFLVNFLEASRPRIPGKIVFRKHGTLIAAESTFLISGIQNYFSR